MSFGEVKISIKGGEEDWSMVDELNFNCKEWKVRVSRKASTDRSTESALHKSIVLIDVY